jgi:YVTN family beta-propeller protein
MTLPVFAQDSTTNSFFVADFATHLVTNNIKLPDIAPAQQNPFAPPSPSHGMVVTSDQKTLLVNSRLNNTLYAYSLPDLKLLAGAALSGKGAEWLTIAPDNKTAYVANSHTNNVSVVDIASMKEVILVPVGFAPGTEHFLDRPVDNPTSKSTIAVADPPWFGDFPRRSATKQAGIRVPAAFPDTIATVLHVYRPAGCVFTQASRAHSCGSCARCR